MYPSKQGVCLMLGFYHLCGKQDLSFMDVSVAYQCFIKCTTYVCYEVCCLDMLCTNCNGWLNHAPIMASDAPERQDAMPSLDAIQSKRE
jgi:hypothetical protein